MSPFTALTIGSSMRRDTPPISSAVARSSAMSLAGSNGSASPWVLVRPWMMYTRLISAPAAVKRGISVSAGSSSLDQIKALPGSLQRLPSGHRPPVVMVAIRPRSSVVFPVPPAPARMCSFPFASQPGQSQRIATGLIDAALATFTFQSAGVASRFIGLSGSTHSSANRSVVI